MIPYHRSVIAVISQKVFSSCSFNILRHSAHGNGFLKAKHPAVSTLIYGVDRQFSVVVATASCQFPPGSKSGGILNKMADSEKPRMRKFQTELSKYATIQKERAKYLSMTLEEKMEKSRMRGRVLSLEDVPSWAEQRRVAKKSRGSPTDLADKVSLWQGDITKLAIGAICNAANRSLLGGGGVDGAIHRAAGSRLYRECESLCGCNTGEAKMTAGYLLPANYVIHTVGPIVHSHSMRGVDPRYAHELASCYRSCLNVVLEHNRKQRQNLKDRSLARSSEDTKDAKKGTKAEVQTASKEAADETTNNTSEANEKKEKSRNGNNKETSKTVSKELSETNSAKTEDQESTGGEDSGGKTESSSKEGESGDVSGESKMEVDASSSDEAKPEGQEVDAAKSETSSTESGGDEKREAEGKTASEDVKSDKVESMDVSPAGTSEGQRSHPPNIQPAEPLIDSIAFPCISTGIYGYPQEEAAHVALKECRDWLRENPNEVERIIFCVFLNSDYDIYEELLPKYFPQGGVKDDTPSASPDEDDETTEDSPKKDKKDPKQETQV